MRKIIFRGKSLKTGEWFCGSLAYFPDSQTAHIIPCGTCKGEDVICDFVEINPESIGQFTGLRDRNGKDVYEGDVVFWIATDMRGRGRGEQGAIFWNKHTMSWAIERDKPCVDGRPFIISRPFDKRHLEVVGNIHDNPELMKL